MDFRTKQKLKNGLTALGLIGLGYFIGRPDQLLRMARSWESHLAESRTQYLSPTRIGTAPNLVQIHQRGYGQPQPAAVNPSAPGQQGWNDFFHPEGRFSVFVPPLQVKEVTNSTTSKTISVQTENELYMVTYDDVHGAGLADQERKQLVLEKASESWGRDSNIGKEFSQVARRSFALNGNPGVEVHYQHKSGQGKRILRKMFVGDRLYGLAVSSPYHENTQTFLNSFRPH